MKFPRGVFSVTNRHGQEYWFYQEGRGTGHAGPRISLGKDINDPQFWTLLRDARSPSDKKAATAGTLAALIAEYKDHTDYKHLRPASRRGYGHFLDRLEAQAGDRPVADMTRVDIYQLTGGMSKTPVAANYMLSVLRTLLEFGVPRGYRGDNGDNPAIGVKRLKVEDSGHRPWPEAGYSFIIEHAPVHLHRMAFLGRATGQRISDLIKMRPADLGEDGINLRIGKLRDKEHFVPLTVAQMTEIRSWGVRDLDFFITTPTTGKQCSERYLNELWTDWRESDEAAPIRDLIMTIHGLRGTAILDRRHVGASNGAIADEIGMSTKMVDRYLRFADKTASARASRDRREEQKRTKFANPPIDLQTHRR